MKGAGPLMNLMALFNWGSKVKSAYSAQSVSLVKATLVTRSIGICLLYLASLIVALPQTERRRRRRRRRGSAAIYI